MVNIAVGEKVKVTAKNIYEGVITEVDQKGFWIADDETKKDYVLLADIKSIEGIDITDKELADFCGWDQETE